MFWYYYNDSDSADIDSELATLEVQTMTMPTLAVHSNFIIVRVQYPVTR
jgi:hypothetical protein